MPWRTTVVLLGRRYGPNRYTRSPRTGQSSFPRSPELRVGVPGAAAAARRARSRAARTSLSRSASRESVARRATAARSEARVSVRLRWCRRSSVTYRSTSSLPSSPPAPLAPPRPQLVLDAEQLATLAGDAASQRIHRAHQGPILARHQVEVLVPAQQVAERLGREHHLEGPEGPALVDVGQTAVQDGPLLGQGVLGEREVEGHRVERRPHAADLAVQLVHQAIGSTLLALDVGQLADDVVGPPAQPAQLGLQLLPFLTNGVEASPVGPDLPVEVLGLGGCGCADEQQQRDGDRKTLSVIRGPLSVREGGDGKRTTENGQRSHPRARCRRRLWALASNPRAVPNRTMSPASAREKNTESNRVRSTARYAA